MKLSTLGQSPIARSSSTGKDMVPPSVDVASGSSSSSTGTSSVASEKRPATIRVKNNTINVAVRVRDLNDRERARHDYESWEACGAHEVALVEEEDVVRVRYKYDHVYDGKATNQMVYQHIARPVVEAVMEGINGTVFAYGVTSSGKTFTMLGDAQHPGLVPLAIQDVFELIERLPDREFLLRLSMLEIYNEIIHDLLDATNANLKLKEDKRSGLVIDGLKEETVVSADHALGVIAAGDAHRKVGSTSYNEYSSRSHTIIRLAIESSAAGGEGGKGSSRTLAMLNLIDLAGSESAKVSYNKDRRLEGGFINKSLLTLGTVMSKLSDGAQGHIPYRDSKLTRMLQGSLTGNGAKIAVVCTITPASSQAEEAHNTLKFANRCKKIEVRARRNELMNDNSLIMRYQEEIRKLRAELDAYSAYASHGNTGPGPGPGSLRSTHDPLHPEVRNLRERLEEEKRALTKREQEKASLESRILRLTRIILHSTKYMHQPQSPRHQRSKSRAASRSRSNSMLLSPAGSERGQNSPRGLLIHPSKSHLALSSPRTLMYAGSEGDLYGVPGLSQLGTPLATPTTYSGFADSTGEQEKSYDVRWPGLETANLSDVEGTVNTIRTAGDLFVGDSLLQHCEDVKEEQHSIRSHSMEYNFLKEQNSVLAGELCERNQQVDRLTEKVAKLEAVEASWAEKAVELQVLKAECHFIQQQLKDTANVNSQLQEEVRRLVLERQAAKEAAQSAKELADARERAAKAAEDRLQAAQQLLSATEMKYAAAQAQMALESLNSDMVDAKLAMADAKQANEAYKREKAEQAAAELQDIAAELERKAATPMTVYVQMPPDEVDNTVEGQQSDCQDVNAMDLVTCINEPAGQEYEQRMWDMRKEQGILAWALPEPSRTPALLQIEGSAVQSQDEETADVPPQQAQGLDKSAVSEQGATPLQALLAAQQVAQSLLMQHKEAAVDSNLIAELANTAETLQQVLKQVQESTDQVHDAVDKDPSQEEKQPQQSELSGGQQQAGEYEDQAMEIRALKLEVARLQGSHAEADKLRAQVQQLAEEVMNARQAPSLTPDKQALLSSAAQLQLQNEQLLGESLHSLSDEQITELQHNVSHSLERLKVEQQLRRTAVVRAMRRSHSSLTSMLGSADLQDDVALSTNASKSAVEADGIPGLELQTASSASEIGKSIVDGSDEVSQGAEMVNEMDGKQNTLDLAPSVICVKADATSAVLRPSILHASLTDLPTTPQESNGDQYFDAGFSDNETDSNGSCVGETSPVAQRCITGAQFPEMTCSMTHAVRNIGEGCEGAAFTDVPSTPKLVRDVIHATVESAFADLQIGYPGS